LLTAFGSAGERQAGSDFPVPTFALPRNVTFSLTTSRGASMSPRSVQFAWRSQRSVTKILPSTVPRTFTDFVLISPRMRACSPISKRSGGNDYALHLAVDEQLVQEFDRAFDRNSSGEKSAGLSWHERAVGWPWDYRWVWPICLREFGAPGRGKAGKSVHGENCVESFGIWEAE
jgi:hypothetical protein